MTNDERAERNATVAAALGWLGVPAPDIHEVRMADLALRKAVERGCTLSLVHGPGLATVQLEAAGLPRVVGTHSNIDEARAMALHGAAVLGLLDARPMLGSTAVAA